MNPSEMPIDFVLQVEAPLDDAAFPSLGATPAAVRFESFRIVSNCFELFRIPPHGEERGVLQAAAMAVGGKDSEDTAEDTGVKHPLHRYWEYMVYLFRRMDAVDEQTRFEHSYRDYLQAPLQPLMDNLGAPCSRANKKAANRNGGGFGGGDELPRLFRDARRFRFTRTPRRFGRCFLGAFPVTPCPMLRFTNFFIAVLHRCGTGSGENQTETQLRPLLFFVLQRTRRTRRSRKTTPSTSSTRRRCTSALRHPDATRVCV